MEDWERRLAEMKEAQEEARTAKVQELRTAWTEDAQSAWDEGDSFYQPIISASVVPEITTRRGAGAEHALQAITSVGWRLHTWTVAGGSIAPSEYGIGVYAHPLFVRPESNAV